MSLSKNCDFLLANTFLTIFVFLAPLDLAMPDREDSEYKGCPFAKAR